MLMGQETELKFIGPDDALARVRRLPLFRRLARNRKPQTRALHAIYFDTDDLALRKAGYVLRVRNEGDGFVQTLKSANGPDVATRTEIKATVASLAPDVGAISDEAVRRRVAKALKKAVLKPQFSVEVRRTKVLLTPKRGTEIEAAFDTGVIRTLGEGRASQAPISELELELLKGSANDLVACAKELTAGQPLMLFLQSKAARGYALIKDEAEAPVYAQRLALSDTATADTAFTGVIGYCLNHLLGNWAAVTIARDPEGIHQMRVALRRLRSALTLFGGPFRTSLRAIEDEVRWLAGVMGEARDLDVFQDEVFRPAAEAHGEDERLRELATVVRTRRRIAWSHVFEALESERFRRLVIELAAVTYSKPWFDATIGGEDAMRDASEFARERLDHRRTRAVKLGKRIDDLDVSERHELRKRLKKLRYACDFFQSLFRKREVKAFVKRLSALQDVLGEMNDAAVARTLVRVILAEQGGDGAASIGYAGGVVVGWHVGHARERSEKLKRRWRRLAKLKAPWR
ncbi:MAG: CYTH and CHAD domain-containing protein [Alphaproteobacteria bacterium]|nr:CYTH and CHAD domain-containing protein [Alphaproteobacteria bacterium]